MKKLWNKFLALFVDEFEVTIWVHPLQKTVYIFKTLEVISPTHIKGRLNNNQKFELRTQEKFNYQIRQVK